MMTADRSIRAEEFWRLAAMQNTRSILVLVAGSVWATVLLALPADAGLSGPPPSFFVPSRDGKSILVMLSRVPLADDRGNACTLPDGTKINLRDKFPSSGLYAVGSTTPVWTVDWYGENRYVFLSEDGRYVVRINRFGGGKLGEGVSLHWGIKFYDAGKEIKSRDVGGLVDYPSLMVPTTWDWHYMWTYVESCDTEVTGGLYHLTTTCRERYAFDVATGKIVEESRYWRPVERRIYGALAVLGVLVTTLVYYTVRRVRRRAAARVQHSATETEDGAFWRGRFQYSLRSLMIFVTVAAVVCSIFRIAPPGGLFPLILGVILATTAAAVLMTYLSWKGWQRIPLLRNLSGTKRVRVYFAAAILFLLAHGLRVEHGSRDGPDILPSPRLAA
jgi:hypothetical protein